MGTAGISSAIMVAVAAGLWFLYLVPTWLRRREYLSTERTAARLQQTLRVMAETAEVPETVRVEATAREAARQDRIRRAAERRADAAAARQAAAVARSAPAAPVDHAALRRARMRRTRLLATLLMTAATLIGVVQIALIAVTGAVIGSWLVLAAAGGLGLVAIGVRRRLDTRAEPRAAAAPRTAPPIEVAPVATRRVGRTEWTPQPLPRPRYLEHAAPVAPPSVSAPDHALALRAAAAEAERAQRAAQAAPEVVPIRAPAASSRFSRMGLVDVRDTAATDLDEVLRRRRNAG